MWSTSASARIAQWSDRVGLRLPIEGTMRHLRGAVDTVSYVRDLLRPDKTVSPQIGDFSSTPVMLIHGFMAHARAMRTLRNRLIQDHFTVGWADLGAFNLADIRLSARNLSQQIEALLDRTNKPKVDLVAHSMGGLIALYYLQHLGGYSRVRRLILLGTPVRGTWSAYIGAGLLGLIAPSVWQLIPDSPFVQEVQQAGIPQDVSCFSVTGESDWICPRSSTQMPGMPSIEIPVGHTSLITDEAGYQVVRDLLRIEDAARAVAARNRKSHEA